MRILFALAFVANIASAQSPKIGNCAVLPADNIWNTRIDQLALHPSSSTWVATIGAASPLHPDFGAGLYAGAPIGIPFVTVPGTQTKYPATFTYQSESDAGPYAVPLNAPIEGGSAGSGDRHALAVDTDNCILYELYAAYPQTASWRADSGAIFDLKSDALRPASWTSADAAGLPIFPGLVRYDEIAAGEIRHAIRFTVPQTQKAYVWPARHYASSLTGAQYPPMGARFRLKSSFDISGYSAANQIILTALKRYGMMLADNGSAWFISGAPDDRWNNDDLHLLTAIKGSNFEAVDVSPWMVNPYSGQVAQSTAATGLEFYPVTPCRLVDTRVNTFQSGFGPPALGAAGTRTFTIPANAACGIPSVASAYSFNVTAVTRGYLGYLSIWPAGQALPNVSTLNSYSTTGTAVANAAIVPAGTSGGVNVYVTDATDVVIDINGYFAPPDTNGLEFYPVTPCRLVDTRVASFPAGFGPPSMGAASTRNFGVPSNATCAIPSTAKAYALNVTAVPQRTLGFLSLWPTGQAMPNVSTLNVYNAGTVVANAAIVPAGGNGAISAYVTDTTDVVVDINGYFGPPGGNGLKFYPVTPCRVADTRVSTFPSGLGPPSMGSGMQRSFPVVSGNCGVPSGAGAYSLNMTAVPRGAKLGVFTTWPSGVTMPDVSTMNSYNGSVVANAAIVPAGSQGAISIYVTDAADVVFDINGYFAP